MHIKKYDSAFTASTLQNIENDLNAIGLPQNEQGSSSQIVMYEFKRGGTFSLTVSVSKAPMGKVGCAYVSRWCTPQVKWVDGIFETRTVTLQSSSLDAAQSRTLAGFIQKFNASNCRIYLDPPQKDSECAALVDENGETLSFPVANMIKV